MVRSLIDIAALMGLTLRWRESWYKEVMLCVLFSELNLSQQGRQQVRVAASLVDWEYRSTLGG